MEHEGTKLICGCGNAIFEIYVEIDADETYDVNFYCTVCGSVPTSSLIKILGRDDAAAVTFDLGAGLRPIS